MKKASVRMGVKLQLNFQGAPYPKKSLILINHLSKCKIFRYLELHCYRPSASTEANVDELPFSQCEISEQSPVTGQTPSTPASTDATVFSFPKLLKSAPAKSLTRECATLDVVFKQPRALPASQKRSTSLRASDEERGSSVGGKIVAPCAGCCSKCGRACCTIGEQAWRGGGSFSVEWSAKRQRRRKHLSSHQKHVCYRDVVRSTTLSISFIGPFDIYSTQLFASPQLLSRTLTTLHRHPPSRYRLLIRLRTTLAKPSTMILQRSRVALPLRVRLVNRYPQTSHRYSRAPPRPRVTSRKIFPRKRWRNGNHRRMRRRRKMTQTMKVVQMPRIR